MDPAQRKLLKKRRRWLIVALVLVLVSTVWWWYWPRGDARFVGKWLDTRSEGGVFDFRRGGLVSWRNAPESAPSTWDYWKVERDVLRIGESLNDPQPSGRVYVVWSWLTGQQWSPGYLAPFRVIEISSNQLTLREIDEETGQESETIVFTRIPE